MRIRSLDYHLILITASILFAIGFICLFGIAYYNYAAAADSFWTQTVKYTDYINLMNSSVYPFLVALLVTLGICIPKRIVPDRLLVKVSIIIFAVTAILAVISGIQTSLGFILAVMMGIQTAVLLLTIKKSASVRFEFRDFSAKVGSSLLHLGVVVFIFDFVNLYEQSIHIPVFWLSTLLIIGGIVMSFYPMNFKIGSYKRN
ncbi:MAG: hypothetical protein ACE5KE_01830 [Methanosarcinales archaeon]